MAKFRNYDKYEIYEDGRIWSYISNKWLKPKIDRDGYQIVCLSDNECKRKWYKVHRIVWESVTGSQIPKGYEINHLSEVKTENFFENLQLVSHKENCNFGTRNSRAAKANTNGKCSKQVGAYKNGELVMVFKSTAEAGRQGFDQSNITKCCRGVKNYKTHKGYEWKYI